MAHLSQDEFFLVAEVNRSVVCFVWTGLTDVPGEGEINGLTCDQLGMVKASGGC